jgi:hypothetical protein
MSEAPMKDSPWIARLLTAGETWAWATSPSPMGGGRDPASFNRPERPETWHALERLADHILIPIEARFGAVIITYGFAGLELSRWVSKRVGRVAPSLDQHASHELRPDGSPICARGGAAVDVMVPGMDTYALARWIADELPFDRLYLYERDRPLHVSHGPQESRAVTHVVRRDGRALPRRLSIEDLRRL